MLGLYVSYNEKKNGSFDEVLEISNKEYLMWKHNSLCKRMLTYPTKIIIRTTVKKEYYKGNLLLVRPYKDFNKNIFNTDISHRPSGWRLSRDDVKTVFFISNLKRIVAPKNFLGKHPPQGITYIDFK